MLELAVYHEGHNSRRDNDIERVDCHGSGALAAENPRMNPAYEDGKGRVHSAVSSDFGSSI
jgi:hypothetical protein